MSKSRSLHNYSLKISTNNNISFIFIFIHFFNYNIIYYILSSIHTSSNKSIIHIFSQYSLNIFLYTKIVYINIGIHYLNISTTDCTLTIIILFHLFKYMMIYKCLHIIILLPPLVTFIMTLSTFLNQLVILTIKSVLTATCCCLLAFPNNLQQLLYEYLFILTISHTSTQINLIILYQN